VGKELTGTSSCRKEVSWAYGGEKEEAILWLFSMWWSDDLVAI
jgi:hypothetical protein